LVLILLSFLEKEKAFFSVEIFICSWLVQTVGIGGRKMNVVLLSGGQRKKVFKAEILFFRALPKNIKM